MHGVDLRRRRLGTIAGADINERECRRPRRGGVQPVRASVLDLAGVSGKPVVAAISGDFALGGGVGRGLHDQDHLEAASSGDRK